MTSQQVSNDSESQSQNHITRFDARRNHHVSAHNHHHRPRGNGDGIPPVGYSGLPHHSTDDGTRGRALPSFAPNKQQLSCSPSPKERHYDRLALLEAKFDLQNETIQSIGLQLRQLQASIDHFSQLPIFMDRGKNTEIEGTDYSQAEARRSISTTAKRAQQLAETSLSASSPRSRDDIMKATVGATAAAVTGSRAAESNYEPDDDHDDDDNESAMTQCIFASSLAASKKRSTAPPHITSDHHVNSPPPACLSAAEAPSSSPPRDHRSAQCHPNDQKQEIQRHRNRNATNVGGLMSASQSQASDDEVDAENVDLELFISQSKAAIIARSSGKDKSVSSKISSNCSRVAPKAESQTLDSLSDNRIVFRSDSRKDGRVGQDGGGLFGEEIKQQGKNGDGHSAHTNQSSFRHETESHFEDSFQDAQSSQRYTETDDEDSYVDRHRYSKHRW